MHTVFCIFVYKSPVQTLEYFEITSYSKAKHLPIAERTLYSKPTIIFCILTPNFWQTSVKIAKKISVVEH